MAPDRLPLIDLAGVERVFPVGEQEVHALCELDLRVGPGEYLCIMGPSGSGKSTLLHIIGLLDRPTAGSYRLESREVADLADDDQARLRRERIGFVFQFFHLVPRLTAAENIDLPMALAGWPPEERRERVRELLSSYGLADRAQHRPAQLSGGERQRVAIARATAMRPAIVLADEPTGNLDRRSGSEVMRLLEELNGQGVTVLVVSHDPEIGARARRLLRMVDGRIVEDRPQEGRA